MAVDLTQPVLYVGETVAVSGNNPGGVRMFNIGVNSTLTEVTGSPFAVAASGPRPSCLSPTTSTPPTKRSPANTIRETSTPSPSRHRGDAYRAEGVTSGTIAAGVGTIGLAEDSKGLTSWR